MVVGILLANENVLKLTFILPLLDAAGFYAFWNSIRSWRFNPRCGTFAFEIKTATGAMGWFSMETRQVRFMYAVVSELTTMAKVTIGW